MKILKVTKTIYKQMNYKNYIILVSTAIDELIENINDDVPGNKKKLIKKEINDYLN